MKKAELCWALSAMCMAALLPVFAETNITEHVKLTE